MIRFERRESAAPWKIWGEGHEPEAVHQLVDACWLPVTVAAAGMADLHSGYGLPIGGVMVTRGCVVPYAVGMDAACRMKLTIIDFDPKAFHGGANEELLTKIINTSTAFGLGAHFEPRRDHEVMWDDAWYQVPFLREHRDLAWSQLGSSGSGNHFVELGTFTLKWDIGGLKPGVYAALLSHSGSRGIGGKACQLYSKMAEAGIDGLPDYLKRFAWFDLKSAEGQEYWTVMELLGKYAAANHRIIHERIVYEMGSTALFQVENHHNFAWREVWNGEEVIVHRKGATPASVGVLGMIPGTRETPGFLVSGKGNPESFNSASHGAGRAMSRKEAKRRFSWADAEGLLMQGGVTLISGGLDETSAGYKDIHKVMAAQTDLVEVVGQFDPVLVKMAPEGERPED